MTWFFVAGALRWVLHERLNASPPSYPTQWHTWEDGRGGGGRLKKETAAKPRAQELVTHSAYTCRACLSVSFEFLRAVARVCGVHVSLLRDTVQCVSRRLLL